MVRIKVVKKSQLVSGVLIALAVLAVLICGWLMWRGAADNGAAGVLSVQTAQADGLNRMYVEAAGRRRRRLVRRRLSERGRRERGRGCGIRG